MRVSIVPNQDNLTGVGVDVLNDSNSAPPGRGRSKVGEQRENPFLMAEP